MAFLDSILDNVDEAIIISNATGDVLFLNSVAARMAQFLTGDELKTGDYMPYLMPLSSRPRVGETLLRVSQEREAEKEFVDCRSATGIAVSLELNYVPVGDEENDVAYTYIFIRDATQQKVFERKMRAQSTYISSLIEKANAIIIGIDAQGYITDWNDYCVKTTGFGKEEVYAQKITNILSTLESRIILDDLLQKLMRNALPDANVEILTRTKDGVTLTLLVSLTPRFTETGNVIGGILVGQDITELTGYRKSLEEKVDQRTRELESALRKEKDVVEMKGRFVSIASHEFRTPLSSIQFAANFVGDNLASLEEWQIRKKLEEILKQTRHMTHLLDDVLTYGKSEAGKIATMPTLFYLDEFLVRLVEDVGHGTKNTHRIIVENENLPLTVILDEKLLRNVLTNLLSNAIKFSPGKASIFFRVQGSDEELSFVVTDEGIGIPEEELEKIFEPFTRGKSVNAIPGTGLGLSIVKKAVELLNGKLTVASQPLQGTTFTVTIPIQP